MMSPVGKTDLLAGPPLIGLSTYREPASWGLFSEPADLLPAMYADEIVAAGGAPMLLPPVARDVDRIAKAVVAGLHGLVLSGGPDIDPARYGRGRGPHTGPARPERDGWEIALAEAALDRGIPLLGVCRGMQLLAVALGATLVQHLPDLVGTDAHCPTPGTHGRHTVRLAEGSRLAGLLGSTALIATHHHQAVEQLPPAALPTAWADDGTIEGFELQRMSWATGVQWHPEAHDGSALFTGFVEASIAWRQEQD
jgi:putative glutamine amidotransferase